MKTPWLIGTVVAVHAVAVVSAVFIQGCGTTAAPSAAPPAAPKMPPASVGEPGKFLKPAPAKPEAAEKTWPAQTTPYVVQNGDCLSAIAARFGLSVKEVMALNGLQKADSIRVGQKLALPGKVNLSTPAPVRKKKPAAPEGAQTHEVVVGDHLSGIAQKYGVTTAALREANAITGDKIMVGQKLVIPPGGKPAVGEAPVEGPAPKPEAPAAVEPSVAAPGIPSAKPGAAPAKTVRPAPPAQTPPAPAAGPAPAAKPAAPAAKPAAPEVKPAASADGTPPAARVHMRVHTVEAGEDLNTVAMMYDVSITELQKVNNIQGTALTPGQVVKIPMAE
jgi:LysM repeat protein